MSTTTILAYVIAFLGLVMIASGVWGCFYLLGQARPVPIRYYAMVIGMICAGFAMEGIAQALRILLAVVTALQQMH